MSDDVYVSVVIAAFNEATRLPATLLALRGLDIIGEIIVVDDGSTDGTARVARGTKTVVLKQNHNAGKGSALQEGVVAARGEVIVFLDADLGPTAALAPALIEPVRQDAADLVIASFRSQRPAGFGIVQRVARQAIRRHTGLLAESPLSGQRAFHRRVLDAVPRFAPGFGAEVALTIDAARAGLRVLEVPVAMTHNETGRDVRGFIHRGKQLWHISKALWQRRLPSGADRLGEGNE